MILPTSKLKEVREDMLNQVKTARSKLMLSLSLFVSALVCVLGGGVGAFV